MQLKSVASLLDASAGTRQQFEEHLEKKKKRVKKVSSLYLSREEKHEEINTVLSCCPRVISEARR